MSRAPRTRRRAALAVALAVAAFAGPACLDGPTDASADCVDHGDCGPCGWCANGRCAASAAGRDRPTCVDEARDPCDGVDDDANGVIDDPDACWIPVFELVGDDGARCLDPSPAPGDADHPCLGATAASASPAFALAREPLAGTRPLHRCSYLHDHALVVASDDRDAPADPPLDAWRALGYRCELLGHALVAGVDAADVPDDAVWGAGRACPLYRFVDTEDRRLPLGTHRAALDAAPADLRAPVCVPEPALWAWTETDGPCPAPPADCVPTPCPPRDAAALVSQAVPDGVVVDAGAAFTQRWELENIGDLTWDARWRFVRSRGTSSKESVAPLSAPVPPGGRAVLEVELTAPAHGIGLIERWDLVGPTNASAATTAGDARPAASDVVGADERVVLGVEHRFHVRTPHAAHLVEVIPEDGAVVRLGTSFQRFITIQNSGPTTWPAGWVLKRVVGGPSWTDRFELPTLPPGSTHTVLTGAASRAGDLGRVVERWEILDAQLRTVPFGEQRGFSFAVNVVADDEALLLWSVPAAGARARPGATRIAAWALRNVGATPWGPGWRLRHVDGPLASEPAVSIPHTVAPGQVVVLATPLLVPTAGADDDARLFTGVGDDGAAPDRWRDDWELVGPDDRVVPVSRRSPSGERVAGAPRDWLWAELEADPHCAR